ncbi:MAG: NAD(P)/FAD-dependent oxidoreductase, partial [Candidatus Hodarchaeota archaeon]
RILAQEGFDVLVLEKSKEIGGSINENLQGFPFYEVSRLNIDVPKDNPVRNATLTSSKERSFQLNFEKPICYLVLRGSGDSFDSHLANQAMDVGAEIELNSEAVGVRSSKERLLSIRTKNGKVFKGRYFVGADGVFSASRRMVGLSPLEIKGISYGMKMENVEIDALSIHGIFNSEVAPRGYGYVIGYPGGRFATVAVSTRPKYSSKNIKEYFRLLLGLIKPIMKNAKEVQPFVGSVTCNDGSHRVVRKNILFIGEAGGFQDPTFGFGMAPSIRSATIASQAISKSHETGNLNVLRDYERTVGSRIFEKEIGWKWKLRKTIIERMNDKDMDAIFSSFRGSEEALERVIQTGDWMLLRRFVFKIIGKRPALLRHIFRIPLLFLPIKGS